MRITIVGAGRVGAHIAKYFADEQQDVFLVDDDAECLSVLESDFNLRTFHGDPTDFHILREANAERADIFVAVTADTAVNLVACAMAKSMGARRTVARVDAPGYLAAENRPVVSRMGVDHVVFPDYLAAESVVDTLHHPWCRGWSEFENGAITLVAVDVTDGSPIAGRYLKELFSESRYLHVSALRRAHKTIIPGGEDRIAAGDTLYVTTLRESADKVRELAGISPADIRKVIVMGGSAPAELAAALSGDDFEVTIIDKDRERCRQLTESLTDTEIICGDASEYDVLEEAGINNCDAFVALTDNTESNILSCLTARDLGVAKTIAEVEKEQLIDKAESFGLGTIINKAIITANAIFSIILDSDASTSKCFTLPDSDVGRLTVRPNSFLTKAAVKDLELPGEITFAGMVRDGVGSMVTGLTRFEPGDIVIVFCLAGSLKKVEKLFGK